MSVFHSRFGADAVNATMKYVFLRLISDEGSTYVFTTGPLRYHYFRDGGKTVPHARADATLSEIARETSSTIELVYLTNAQEAQYGFDTMLEHSKVILDDAIEKAGITANEVGIVHAGTTSFQTGVYNRTAGAVSHLNSFDYGTNNQNPDGFAELCAWMAATPVHDFVSFGSESYAVPKGKIATTHCVDGNAFHSDLDSSTRAYAAALCTMTAASEMGKSYYIPERKAWEAKTSATLTLRKLYPTGTLLDWGGGQVKDEKSGGKWNFDQRVLFA